MSDRPCNLTLHLRHVREYGDRLTLRARDDGWTDWYVDGKFRGSYWVLPTPEDCGAAGGSCEC